MLSADISSFGSNKTYQFSVSLNPILGLLLKDHCTGAVIPYLEFEEPGVVLNTKLINLESTQQEVENLRNLESREIMCSRQIL